MKKGMIIMSLAASVIAAQTMPAQAINKEWSAVAGFVGGVLVANAHNHHKQVVKQSYLEHDRYRQPSQRVGYRTPARRTVVYEEPVRTGYYTWETRRVYVPDRGL